MEDDIVAMLEHAVSCFGSLDVLFNNAGVGGAIGPLTETRVEDWDYTFDVLAKGVFLGHQARGADHEGGGSWRFHHQHRFHCRPVRRRRPAGLLGGEGGGDQPQSQSAAVELARLTGFG